MRQADFTNFHLRYSLHKEVDADRRGHTSIHCDYEDGEWFYDQLINWMKKHIPGYALSPKEVKNIRPEQLFDMTERAAKLVYGRSAKTDRRGEIGEIILHGLICDIYKTSPLISKVFHKSARSDTVKGFDCVHVVIEDNEIESLWLGEAKFYTDIGAAIREAVASIKDITEAIRLRDEFMLISNDIDADDEIGQKALKLIDRGNSLDDITKKICIPVLLTYESQAVNKHTIVSSDFQSDLQKEVTKHIEAFNGLATDIEIDIHVFIFSVGQKKEIIKKFDQHLKGHQADV